MTESKVAIALVGAAGRMGQEITRAASRRDDVRIGSAVDRAGAPCIGRDLGETAGVGALGVRIVDDLDRAFGEADVVVDLSLPDATEKVAAAAQRNRRPLVCGTTGLDPERLLALDRASAEIPVLYTPNLSLGVALVAALAERAAGVLGAEYDIEIVETHHRNKVDAPSGTALALARAAARGAGLDPATALVHGRSGHVGKRPAAEIGVHAVRGGGVFGEHTIAFLGEHERIEISHRAASRALFAEGAIRAALFLRGKPPGRYTMNDLLGLPG